MRRLLGVQRYAADMPRSRKADSPFRYFKTLPEIIRLDVGDLLFERGIDISHETARYWWNRFGPIEPE